MPRTAFAPRLILPDGRFRLILDRVDPLAIYQPLRPVALADGGSPLPVWALAEWHRSARKLIAEQRQQMLAFLTGFTASVAVVLTAMAAQPTPKLTEAPAVTKPDLVAESRVGTFATPALVSRIRVAKITVAPEEAPVAAPTPTPAFAQVVAPVVAAFALPPTESARPLATHQPQQVVARTEAPIAMRPAAAAPAKGKARAASAPVKAAKVEFKPVIVRPVGRPSPQMAQAMASSPPPIGAPTKASATRPSPPWANTWMRSTLGMSQDGP